MNKKLMTFGVLGLFAISLVVAVGYYALFSVTFNVTPAISIDEECGDTLQDIYSGESYIGSPCIITNKALTERTITITEDSDENISVSYVADLILTKKDTTTWIPTEDKITITYTVIGDTFEFSEISEGYTLIYYKDAVVGLEGRIANPQPAIIVTSDIGNLAQLDDANIDALANYCAEPDYYNQCKGAKLWVVPTSDIIDGNLNWANMANYYYETDLIQYNMEGNLVMSPESNITIIPVYTIGDYASEEYTITTTIA